MSRLITGKVKPVVDSVFNFEDVYKGYERMMSSRAMGKVILKVDPTVEWLWPRLLRYPFYSPSHATTHHDCYHAQLRCPSISGLWTSRIRFILAAQSSEFAWLRSRIWATQYSCPLAKKSISLEVYIVVCVCCWDVKERWDIGPWHFALEIQDCNICRICTWLVHHFYVPRAPSD